jgi:4-hydroxy-tetrahydrodipicolinate reductase
VQARGAEHRARDPVRVLLMGTGQMGSGIARLLLDKPDLELVGVYARRSSDLAALVAECRPEVAIQATCSTLADAEDEIATCLERGVNTLTIAEEAAWPDAYATAWAERMHGLAVQHGVTLLGTGVNPGFVLDLLVIALTGVCERVESITATRVNDLSPYGPSVLRSQGVGLTPQEFREELHAGTVVGHVGFPASIGMIAAALGAEVEPVEETREPIVSKVRRETPFVTVEPGRVAGCRHTATARREGRPFIRLIHPQQVRPELEGVETGDLIEIAGRPELRIAGSPEIPGGVATIALAVNMVPRVLAAPPGLTSMAELPVPAALPGDLRRITAGGRAGG